MTVVDQQKPCRESAVTRSRQPVQPTSRTSHVKRESVHHKEWVWIVDADDDNQTKGADRPTETSRFDPLVRICMLARLLSP